MSQSVDIRCQTCGRRWDYCNCEPNVPAERLAEEVIVWVPPTPLRPHPFDGRGRPVVQFTPTIAELEQSADGLRVEVGAVVDAPFARGDWCKRKGNPAAVAMKVLTCERRTGHARVLWIVESEGYGGAVISSFADQLVMCNPPKSWELLTQDEKDVKLVRDAIENPWLQIWTPGLIAAMRTTVVLAEKQFTRTPAPEAAPNGQG